MDGTTQAIELKKADMIQAASISVPHRGLSLREVGLTRSGAAPVSAAVFAAGIAQVGAVFGIDYVGKGEGITPDVAKVRLLWEMIRKRGWSDADFATALDRFLQTVKFPTWTPADFIGESGNAPDVKVYPHSWYLDQIAVSRTNGEAIGCYQLEGYDRPVWGWRHEVGDHLPAWEAKAAPLQIAESATDHPPTDDGAETRAELLDRLKLEAKVEALERENGRLKTEMESLRKRLSERASEKAWLEQRVMRLEMGLAAVLATLEEDRQAARAGAMQYDAEAWTPEINRLTNLLEGGIGEDDTLRPVEVGR